MVRMHWGRTLSLGFVMILLSVGKVGTCWHSLIPPGCAAIRAIRRPNSHGVRWKHARSATADVDDTEFVRPLLEKAHQEWGRSFETYVVDLLSSGPNDEKYHPLLGASYNVAMGQQGEIDFLAVGSPGAWRNFAKDRAVHMNEKARSSLTGNHLIIAEVGLTFKTLQRKFSNNATSLRFLNSFHAVSTAHGIPAVKVLVYDGATQDVLAFQN